MAHSSSPVNATYRSMIPLAAARCDWKISYTVRTAVIRRSALAGTKSMLIGHVQRRSRPFSSRGANLPARHKQEIDGSRWAKSGSRRIEPSMNGGSYEYDKRRVTSSANDQWIIADEKNVLSCWQILGGRLEASRTRKRASPYAPTPQDPLPLPRLRTPNPQSLLRPTRRHSMADGGRSSRHANRTRLRQSVGRRSRHCGADSTSVSAKTAAT